MITLWKVNHIDPYDSHCDRIAWMWIDDSENDDFAEWCADDSINALPQCRVGSIEDVGAIAEASRRQWFDHLESDAVNTPDGLRVI